MENYRSYIRRDRDRFLQELAELCAVPSIAAHGRGMEEAASLIEQRLASLGAQVRRITVDASAPILVAELGEGERTLLVYNHYDVQPADPLDEWLSDPFVLTERGGQVYARGVADNKGDLMSRLHAIEAYQATCGALPLRVRFLIEGEEEIGSPHLDRFAAEYPELLEADGCLWEGGGKDLARRCVLTLGVKGLCYVELATRSAASDLHSMWGGIVPSAAWRLLWALASLKGADDRITVDGLMDHVQPPTPAEREHLATIPFDEEQTKRAFGLAGFVRDLTGVDLLLKHFYEPSCDVCGLKSGYIDAGVKTVLPGTAMAKVSFRLVPDLTPELVVELLRAHLDRRGFGDVEVSSLSGVRPARSPLDAAIVRAARDAARAAFGGEPIVYPTSPGSGPLFALCSETPTVMAGVAHDNARYHAPNENIYVEDYLEGMAFFGELVTRFAREEGGDRCLRSNRSD